MSGPLSPEREQQIREAVPSTVCPAAHPDEVDKGHVWVTGCLSGRDRCSACHTSQSALDSDEAVLLAELDRVRAELAPVRAQVAAVEEHARRKADRGIVVDPNILLMLLDDHAVPAGGGASQ